MRFPHTVYLVSLSCAQPSTIEGNREILDWLRGNKTVFVESEKRHRNVTLIDFKDLDRNVFQVTYEWTFRAMNKKGNRADVMFLVKLTRTVEFDEATLKALKEQKGSDSGKVINLVKSLAKTASDRGTKEPYLISIAERAESVMNALEDRQVSTTEAMAKIEALMKEKLEAEKARKESGLDPDTFEIFWFLQQEKLPEALMLAKEISAVYSRFPNFATNADEQRQLKAEIYKSLLRVVSGKRMVDIGEELLRLRGV